MREGRPPDAMRRSHIQPQADWITANSALILGLPPSAGEARQRWAECIIETMNTSIAERALPWLLVTYCAASFLHFAHNAEYLADYPNLPDWLSRSQVYLACLAILATGILGYVLYRRGQGLVGLAVLAVYAGVGFDGLLHYTRAPFADHTIAMNATIWSEVVAAAFLFIAVMKCGAERVRLRWRVS